MQLPDYVTLAEVKRVCKELKIKDWTTLGEPKVLAEEAKAILSELDIGDMKVPLEDFIRGLEVELEHGTFFPESNVTNNHPVLTGKIVIAHFQESLDYYKRLEVAELEGDLLKATVSKNALKVETLYRKLVKEKLALSQAENTML